MHVVGFEVWCPVRRREEGIMHVKKEKRKKKDHVVIFGWLSRCPNSDKTPHVCLVFAGKRTSEPLHGLTGSSLNDKN